MDKVSDEVLPFFEEIADNIITNIGAKKALCKALAFMSGNLKKIEHRSLLTGGENLVTFQVKLSSEIHSPSYVWQLLRGATSPDVVDGVKNMRMLANFMGVVFDVSEEKLQAFEDTVVQSTRGPSARF